MNTAFNVIANSIHYVQNACWFSWQDNPPGSEYFGVLDSNGNARTCYNDFASWQTYRGYRANGTINSAIQGYYNARGEAVMGSPYDNGGGPLVHTWTGGAYSAEVQDCNGGSHNRLCIFNSSSGTYEVNNGFWSTYLTNGGMGYYGPPTGNEYGYGGGTRQNFKSGHYFTWTASGGVVSH